LQMKACVCVQTQAPSCCTAAVWSEPRARVVNVPGGPAVCFGSSEASGAAAAALTPWSSAWAIRSSSNKVPEQQQQQQQQCLWPAAVPSEQHGRVWPGEGTPGHHCSSSSNSTFGLLLCHQGGAGRGRHGRAHQGSTTEAAAAAAVPLACSVPSGRQSMAVQLTPGRCREGVARHSFKVPIQVLKFHGQWLLFTVRLHQQHRHGAQAVHMFKGRL
jgi:hypothetical protein